MNTEVTFIYEGKTSTRKTLTFTTLVELEAYLVLADAWEKAVVGRKAYGFSKGRFATTRIYGLLAHWLPKEVIRQANLDLASFE